MEEGYIKLYRSLLEWEWFSDAKTLKAWMYILMKANWIERRWCGHVIPRGSFVTSRDRLAKELGMTPQNIRTILSRLKKTGEITIKSTNKYTIITICNYDSYQQDYIADQPADQPTNNQQTTNKQPQHNNINKLKNNINNNNSKNEILKFNFPKQVEVEKFKEWLMYEADESWKEVAMMQLGIKTKDELEKHFERFQNEAIAQGVKEESEKEIKSHFINQTRIVIKKSKERRIKDGQESNTEGTYRIGKTVHTDPRILAKLAKNVLDTEERLANGK